MTHILNLLLTILAVRFAFMTDLHIADGAKSQKDLSLCIKDINSIKDGLDFVIIGGDITEFGSDSELALVKAQLDSLQLPYYVIAGNHDAKWSESGTNTHLRVFGYEQFSFEKGGWRFIGCNSGPDMRMAPALLPTQTMNWLKEQDGSVKGEKYSRSQKTIFVNHYPMDSSVLNYPDVVRAMKKAGVRQELAGHWHTNRILDFDGVPGVTLRSTMSGAGTLAGYNIVEIDDNDVMTARERRVGSSSAVTLPAWYTRKLDPVEVDDSTELPDSYVWMRYDVNDRYTNVKEVWRVEEDGNIAAGFAVNGDNAYFAMEDGRVKCISIKSGKEKWSVTLPGKIYSTPEYADGSVVIGCTDGGIYSLNAKNGRTKWCTMANKSVLASPVIRDGAVFIGSSDGIFRALNLKDGSVRWTFDGVKGFVETKAYVDAAQVVFGSWGNELYSLDTRTGKLQWKWDIKGSRMYSPAACWPVKADGKIFVTLPDRKLHVIDAAKGNELYTVEGGRESIGLSEDGKTVFVKTMHSRLWALPVDSQKTAWDVRTQLGYDISPTGYNEKWGQLLVPTDKGNVVSFDSATGECLWAHKVSLALVNPMHVFGKGGKKYVLLSTMDGVVTLMEF